MALVVTRAFGVSPAALGRIVFAGSLLLVVAGIVAYIGLVFITMYIAVEDENVVTAHRQSWRLVRPEFPSVLGLLLVTVVGFGIVGVRSPRSATFRARSTLLTRANPFTAVLNTLCMHRTSSVRF